MFYANLWQGKQCLVRSGTQGYPPVSTSAHRVCVRACAIVRAIRVLASMWSMYSLVCLLTTSPCLITWCHGTSSSRVIVPVGEEHSACYCLPHVKSTVLMTGMSKQGSIESFTSVQLIAPSRFLPPRGCVCACVADAPPGIKYPVRGRDTERVVSGGV